MNEKQCPSCKDHFDNSKLVALSGVKFEREIWVCKPCYAEHRKAQNAELLEALKPFAKFAQAIVDRFGEDGLDDDSPMDQVDIPDRLFPKFTDCAKARSAIRRAEEGKDSE